MASLPNLSVSTMSTRGPLLETPDFFLRLMHPNEAHLLTKMLYESYEDSYPDKNLYDEEKVRSLLKEGKMHSCLALSKKHSMPAGHLSLVFDAQDTIAYCYCGLVYTKFRGHNLLGDMLLFLQKYASQTGLHGFYYEVVTAHPIAQKGSLFSGSMEIGYLPAHLPGGMFYRDIFDKTLRSRLNAFLYFSKTNPLPARNLYLPPEYMETAERIFFLLGVERNFSGTAGEAPSLERPRCELKIEILMDWQTGFITVLEYGQDLVPRILRIMNENISDRLPAFYIYLPMHDPAVLNTTHKLKAQGCFFAGIIPELYEHGDALCLQFFPHRSLINPVSDEIVSEHGELMRNFVLKEIGIDADAS